MSDDIVKFLMPDGTEVSNDPRFDQEKALEKALASRENTGDIGISDAEMRAQTLVERPATLNSGQPGVGPNAVPDDIERDLHGPLGSPAQQVQKEDYAQAQAEGGSPNSTTVDDDEPVNSNEAVLQVREERKKLLEKAKAAQDKLGEDGPGDTDKPYDEWSGAQLKAEVATRNAEEGRAEDDQLELKSGMKKADVAKLLEDDDVRKANAGADRE
jgi:hypothetical protein